jgi:hypothetical protein
MFLRELSPHGVSGSDLSSSGQVEVLKGHGFSRAAYQAKLTRALQAAEKLVPTGTREGFVSGHDFSRAATSRK